MSDAPRPHRARPRDGKTILLAWAIIFFGLAAGAAYFATSDARGDTVAIAQLATPALAFVGVLFFLPWRLSCTSGRRGQADRLQSAPTCTVSRSGT